MTGDDRTKPSQAEGDRETVDAALEAHGLGAGGGRPPTARMPARRPVRVRSSPRRATIRARPRATARRSTRICASRAGSHSRRAGAAG